MPPRQKLPAYKQRPGKAPQSSSEAPTHPEFASDAQILEWLGGSEKNLKTFNELNDKRIFQETFYRMEDFAAFGIEEIARKHGFLSLVDERVNRVKIYPFLVKLFYANLCGNFFEPPNGSGENMIWSRVMGVDIVLSVKELGILLDCKYWGNNIDDIDHINFEYNSTSYKFRMEKTQNTAVNLRPQARILNKMLIHTILPRTGSYEKMYDENYKALYAIYSNQDINWAKVILDQIKSFHGKYRKTIFFASYLTKIFVHFGINIDNLQDFIPPKVMDQKAISLMKLPAQMEPLPPYNQYLSNLVREHVIPTQGQPGSSSHAPQLSENISWTSESEGEISMVQPSRSTSATSAILQNQEIIFKQQRKMNKRQKKFGEILEKIWKKISSCSSGSDNE